MTLKEKVTDKIEEMRALKKIKEQFQHLSLDTIFEVYSKQLLEAKKSLNDNEIALEKAQKDGNEKDIEKFTKAVEEQKKWLNFVENKIGVDGRVAKAAGGFRVEKDKSKEKV